MWRELKSTLTYFFGCTVFNIFFSFEGFIFIKIFTFLKSFIFLPLPQFSRLTPTMPSVAPAPALPWARIRNFNQLHVLLHFSFDFLLTSSLELTSPLKPLTLQVLQFLLHSFIPSHVLLQISFHFLHFFEPTSQEFHLGSISLKMCQIWCFYEINRCCYVWGKMQETSYFYSCQELRAVLQSETRIRSHRASQIWPKSDKSKDQFEHIFCLLFVSSLGKTSIEKKRFLSGIARMRGGGLPMPGFFGPLFLLSNSP